MDYIAHVWRPRAANDHRSAVELEHCRWSGTAANRAAAETAARRAWHERHRGGHDAGETLEILLR
jgi:hypothetical protein